jgi:hypothetical protein
MIFFASCKRSRASQIVNRSSLGAMRQPGGVSSGSRMVESIPADINARWARSASERYRNPCAGAMSLLMANSVNMINPVDANKRALGGILG